MIKSSLKNILLFTVISFVLFPPYEVYAQQANVVEITIDQAITPATDDFLKESLGKSENADLFLIHLNTPGGLLPSMQTMVESILQSKVPVVVYVNPQGGGAISAGVFITLAAHVAVMAPGTTIGAAHPVQGDGKDVQKDMRAKIENFTVSLITAISEQRGRNVEWAKKAVTDSVSITNKEAVKINVVDFTASNVDELLKKISGKKVLVNNKEVILNDLSKASRTELEMNFKQKVVALLSDPNISVLLGLAGMGGLGIEMYNPGLIVPGVIGAICLILSLVSSQVIPINTGGIILILVSGVFFVLELLIPSFGIWGVAGAVCLVLGAIYYVDPSQIWSGEGFGVDIPMVGITAAIIGGSLMFFALWAVKLRNQKISTGEQGMVGLEGIVSEDFIQRGKYFMGKIDVRGEIWNAKSEVELKKDQDVKVESINGLELKVKI